VIAPAFFRIQVGGDQRRLAARMAAMMRDDGEVPVLDANSLGLLPDASGPWLPLPAAGLSLDNRDLSATAKRVVGMALAPVGSGKQKLPLLTVDAVRAVKNGQPWTAASVTQLYDELRAHECASLLSDGHGHTATVPADLLGLATAAAVRVEVCWDVDAWKAKKQKKGGADADEAARLMKGLRDIFNDTNQLQSKMNMLIHNGKEPSVFQSVASFVTQSQPVQAIRRYCNGGLVVGPGTGTSDEIQALLSHGESVNTEAETDRIIALGGGDYDVGRAKVTELLDSRRAAQQAMLNQYNILIKEAIMSARGTAGASREVILQAIRDKYGLTPSAEDLDTVLGGDGDFVETSGGMWDYLPWWLGGTQVPKKPAVRKSPALGVKKTLKKTATPTKAPTLKKAAALKKAAMPEKAATPKKKESSDEMNESKDMDNSDYMAHTADELKDICSGLGLDGRGNKGALVERIKQMRDSAAQTNSSSVMAMCKHAITTLDPRTGVGISLDRIARFIKLAYDKELTQGSLTTALSSDIFIACNRRRTTYLIRTRTPLQDCQNFRWQS